MVSVAQPGTAPIAGSADEGGVNDLTTFDATLTQAWQPHQPISLRPSVVMDLIVGFDGHDGSGGSHSGDDPLLPSTDEQNQQLLDVLLQPYGQSRGAQSTPPMTIAPFPHSTPLADSHSVAEPLPINGEDKSSPLINLLKSIGPRLDIVPPAAVTSEQPAVRLMAEGGIGAIPAAMTPVANTESHTAAAQHAENKLVLANNQKEWPQQLRTALGERLQLQVESKVQHATIRLDPPDMGKIDISLHMEGGKLQVHINASQGDVYRALQQSSAELRQTLMGQNTTAVEVQISANSQQQQRQQQQSQQQQADILAAQHIDTQIEMSTDDGTLLITV
nr:flagellar hook-length control protein FliK [Yersinia sp. Marseille-Q3913]